MEVVENYIVEEDLPPLNATDPVGPRNIPDGINRSPLALWKLFITDDMIYWIVATSNSFSESIKQRHRHRQFDFDEILAFIGIVMYMGISSIGERHRYWEQGPSFSSYVSSVMSRWRFDSILRCFHWIDTSKISDEEHI